MGFLCQVGPLSVCEHHLAFSSPPLQCPSLCPAGLQCLHVYQTEVSVGRTAEVLWGRQGEFMCPCLEGEGLHITTVGVAEEQQLT